MPRPDDPPQRLPAPPPLSPAGVADLSRLLDGLDLLDRLLRLPSAPGGGGDVRLGRFRVRRRIGAGRYGIVFRAEDPDLGREVVVKVPQLAVLADPDLRARFGHEAKAAARLDHPAIVPVYEVGEDSGLAYLAAGLVDGPTLAAWLAARPAPPDPRTAARLVGVLARAVQHAHDRGVLHCDLKPANVLIGPQQDPGVAGVGSPRVTDFGLARLLEQDPGAAPAALGTPLYMAPEQARTGRHDVTRRTDVYGLGAVLYELLAGRPPFGGADSTEITSRVVSDDPVPPGRHRPGVPRDLEAVCLRCLRKDPGDRYESAAAAADDLGRFLAGEPVRARAYGRVERAGLWVRRRPAAAGLVVLLVALGVVTALGTAREYRQVRDHNTELTAALEREREEERLRRAAVERERVLAGGLRLHRYATAVASAGSLADAGRTDLLRPLLADLEPGPGEDDHREFAWHYLSAVTPERQRLRGPEATVRRVAVSPDGCRYAAAYDHGEVIVWEPGTGRGGWSHRGVPERGRPYGFAFSPDGRRLGVVTMGWRGSFARVWETATGRLAGERAEHGCTYLDLAFAPDGAAVYPRDVAGGAALVQWDVEGGGVRVDKTIPSALVVTARLRPNLGALALAVKPDPHGQEVMFEHWAVGPAGPAREAAAGPFGHIYQIEYSPDGALVAFSPSGQSFRVLERRTGREVFRGRDGGPERPDLAFSADGRTLAASVPGPHRRVELWDVAAGRYEAELRLGLAPTAVAFSPNGTLAVGHDDGSVGLWDVRRPAPSRRLTGHKGEVWAVAFAPNGGTVASAGDDATVRVWDAGAGAEREILAGHPSLVTSVAHTPDGRAVVSGGYDGTVRVWDAAGVGQVLEPAHTAPVTGVAVSADGGAASRGRDGVIRVWDLATRARRRDLPCHRGMTGAVTFSPDGRTLAVASGGEGLKSWDVVTGEAGVVVPDPDYTWSVAFSRDGRFLAVGSGNGTVRVLDAATRNLQAVLVGHEGGVRSVAFSPDGRTLATGGDDTTVRLWHVPTGLELLALRGHTGKVFSVAFSPDGRTLASGSHDGTVRLWP